MAARRYLLLLGSNLATPECVDAALAALATLGTPVALTAITRTPARHHPEQHYFNALAQLDCALDRDALVERLKMLETDLGRVRDGSGVVAIDIDLLAALMDGVWHADPHAVAKREFSQSPAREMLANTGITLVADDP